MDVREQIIEVATRQFSARGFEPTSLAEIARTVGVTKASLLYHFKSKDELRRAVLDAMLRRWNDILPRLLMVAASGTDQFDGVVDALVGFFADDADRARLLLREVLDRPDELKSLIDTHVQPWTDVVADSIRKGQKQGRVHPEVDPEAYVVQVISLVVASVATCDCFAGLFTTDADLGAVERSVPHNPGPNQQLSPHAARSTRELQRVAKFSLFKR